MDDTTDFAQTCVGTPYYLSPELIEGRPYNQLSDVWALGVLLFQMVAFRYPFEAPTLPALALKIVACDHCPLPEDTPSDLRELIATLLSRSQLQRPTMEAVMQLPVVLKRKNRFEREMQRLWRAPRTERPAASAASPMPAGGFAATTGAANGVASSSAAAGAAAAAAGGGGSAGADSSAAAHSGGTQPSAAAAMAAAVSAEKSARQGGAFGAAAAAAALPPPEQQVPAPLLPEPVAPSSSQALSATTATSDAATSAAASAAASATASAAASAAATSVSPPLMPSAPSVGMALLPQSYSGPFPLEPTPLDVAAADRELLASQFAEAGEVLYCIATVYKVGERGKRSERTLAVGEHRLIYLKPKKKGSSYSLASAHSGNERSRQRMLFWHELLSCAGSADERNQLRLCFIPQQGRSMALPSLFLAKLAKLSGYGAEQMWQLLLEFKSPAVLTTLLYSMRRAFEGIWRALGSLSDERAPQLAAPQWQLLMPEHIESTELAVRHAAAAARAAALNPPPDWAAEVVRAADVNADGGASAAGLPRNGSADFAVSFVMALRHLCAYHDCTLRDAVAVHLMRHLTRPTPALDLSLLLRLPHTSPPPYVDATPRRLSTTLDGPHGDRLPTPKPAASIAEVRALAAALCCCGGVHTVQAIDVRLGEEAIIAFAEVLRFSSHLSALRLNHVTSNSNAARQSMSTLVDMLPNARAPLTTLDIAHNAHLEEPSLLRLIAALKGLPRGLQGLQLDGCGLTARSAEALGAVLSEGQWPATLRTFTLAHNSIGREEGSVALAAALRCSSGLTTLDVTHTGLDMPTLLEALLANERLLSGLQQLHLGTNKLSRAAAASLAEMLSRAASLRQLGVSRTQLLPESFEPIFGAALANGRLTELSIDASDNELGERCARGLAEQLRRMGGAASGRPSGLVGLKMRSTSLTEGGVCALLEPLAVQTNLLQLDLDRKSACRERV